jgi:hypothetical protein
MKSQAIGALAALDARRATGAAVVGAIKVRSVMTKLRQLATPVGPQLCPRARLDDIEIFLVRSEDGLIEFALVAVAIEVRDRVAAAVNMPILLRLAVAHVPFLVEQREQLASRAADRREQTLIANVKVALRSIERHEQVFGTPERAYAIELNRRKTAA